MYMYLLKHGTLALALYMLPVPVLVQFLKFNNAFRKPRSLYSTGTPPDMSQSSYEPVSRLYYYGSAGPEKQVAMC